MLRDSILCETTPGPSMGDFGSRKHGSSHLVLTPEYSTTDCTNDLRLGVIKSSQVLLKLVSRRLFGVYEVGGVGGELQMVIVMIAAQGVPYHCSNHSSMIQRAFFIAIIIL